jgi:hypothetical protein
MRTAAAHSAESRIMDNTLLAVRGRARGGRLAVRARHALLLIAALAAIATSSASPIAAAPIDRPSPEIAPEPEHEVAADPFSGASLNGYVVDAETKETLVSATVVVRGTRLGAVTNKSGYFIIKGIPAGKYTVVVTYLGYEKLEKEVTLTDGDVRKVSFELKPSALQSEGVTVSADRTEDRREINVSRVNIPVAELQRLRIGGEADLFRSLQFLPGILTSSQISSGLYIRGGSPDQNLVLIDGSTVYNPSHLFGFFSTFNPDAVKDVDLIKGGYPAEYGGRLSAVLNVTQKDGNREKFEGVGSLGLISSRLSLQGPIGRGSWFIGGRRTYLDLIMGLIPEDPENPLPNFWFYDGNAKVTQDLSDNDRLFISGFVSRDRLNLDGAGLLFEMGIGNQTGSARWTHIFGDGLFTSLNLSASHYETFFNGDQGGFKFGIENSITDYTAKAGLEWYLSEDLTAKAGAELTRYEFKYVQNFSGRSDSTAPEGSTQEGGRTNLVVPDWTYSGYGQLNYQVSSLLSLQGGVHASYLVLSDRWTIDPRAAAHLQFTPEIGLKAAWGIYHQYLRLATLQDFSFFDTWLPTDSTVVPSRAVHYVLGLETTPYEGYEVNLDAYYKTLDDISELNQFATQADQVSEVFFSGTGTAYGAELFVQKKTGDLTGWFGYALGWVNARFDSINGGREFRPKYDRRHDLKIVAQYKLDERWELGASFTFQTGQSYTGVSSRFRTELPGQSTGADVTVPADRYGLRLPPSHQLNINVNYNTTLFDLPMRLLLDVYNVYSRRDIWFRYYDTKKEVTEVTDVRLLPIIPTLSIELKF